MNYITIIFLVIGILCGCVAMHFLDRKIPRGSIFVRQYEDGTPPTVEVTIPIDILLTADEIYVKIHHETQKENPKYFSDKRIRDLTDVVNVRDSH